MPEEEEAVSASLAGSNGEPEARGAGGRPSRKRLYAILVLLVLAAYAALCCRAFANDVLYWAARRGHVIVAWTALAWGADPTWQNQYDDTALQGAIRNAQKDVVALLLAHGTDVNKPGRWEYTAVHEAASWANPRGHCHSGMTVGGTRSDRREILQMVLDAGGDLEADAGYGRTPLRIAALEGDADTVRLLVAAGARVDDGGKDGFTVLHEAAGDGLTEVVDALLDAGADVSAGDASGWSPLDYAVAYGRGTERGEETIALLLARGAKPDESAAAMMDDGQVSRGARE